MDLHRDLLMLESKRLADESGRRMNPYELLHASLHDPEFAWLRAMSALIVTIDTVIDESTNLSGKEISQIADEVMKLIEPDKDQATHEFWQKYSAYLSSADIIMKHSTVKDLIARLKPNM